MFNFKSLLLILCIVPQLSFASHPRALKDLVDDYTYSMTVEWDQSNQDFYQSKTEEFQKQLSVLVENGLTEQEVKSVFPEVNQNVPEGELASFILNNHKSFYTKGASWNEMIIFYGLSATILVVLAYKLTQHALKLACKERKTKNPSDPCVI